LPTGESRQFSRMTRASRVARLVSRPHDAGTALLRRIFDVLCHYGIVDLSPKAFLPSLRLRQEKARKPVNWFPGLRISADAYLTRMNIVANVYSAMDSISTSAKIRANRIAAVAPGFRAMPSQAAAVALAWA
jgi:hypothetical protein